MTQDFKNFTVSPQSPALDAFVIKSSVTALAVRTRVTYAMRLYLVNKESKNNG